MNHLKHLLIIITISLFLSACGSKPTTPDITPTPLPQIFEIPKDSRPYISLIPRSDGHLLTLKINDIPEIISQIEYEVLYTAIDNGNEIEKGVGDTIKTVTKNIEKPILLGTESCTNGCKYKYDTGVVGGTVSIKFITKDNQTAIYQAPFTLKSSSEIKKSGNIIGLPTESFSIKANIVGNNYYVLIKNYNNNFSVFSDSPSASKYISITPETVTKNSPELSGDYISN